MQKRQRCVSVNEAIFSPCGAYRYALWRLWDHQKSFIMFVGLNPSLADADSDDPTIRRVKRFAREWGYGGVYVLNLFAYVTPYPQLLFQASHPIGHLNDHYLRFFGGACDEIVFCWGSSDTRGRSEKVMRMFPRARCIQKNKNGSPRHPLYIAAKENLKVY